MASLETDGLEEWHYIFLGPRFPWLDEEMVEVERLAEFFLGRVLVCALLCVCVFLRVVQMWYGFSYRFRYRHV